MSHTYSTNVVHCVFSTKHRRDMIADQTKLFGYLSGVARHLKVPLLAIGGTVNHVHVLISVPPTQNLAKIMCDLKANSSRWLNENGTRFAWQQGYAAFSVSPSRVAAVRKYIQHQAEHHKKRNFEQEFCDLLLQSGVAFDSRDALR
jgi:putative transposase